MSTVLGSQIKHPAETGGGAVRPVRALFPLDPTLLLAVLGLVACSLVTLSAATHDDIPGDPNYYVYRQAGFAAVGLVFCLILSRFDYSRLRELKYGLYGFMLGSILLVLAIGGATRGSKRWIDFPFFRFQPSELGKLLLVLAISAFVVDRIRRLQERDTTARVC